jgi:hypothetical protein
VTLPGDHATAQVQFFRADPPQPGDQGGIILYYKEPSSGFSGAGVGSIRTTSDGNFGELIRFDKLPLPNIPPGLNITLDHLQLDIGAGSAAAPPAVPGSKPRPRHHKVRLKCKRYRGHGRKRRCVAYRHGANARVAEHARASAATSFITNPSSCDADGWTIQLQVDYKNGQERREAQAPCASR